MCAYMTAPMVPIALERESPSDSWGFRLQGGVDYRLHLSIKKVNPNTPAHNRLHTGDVIVSINGVDANQLTHNQAHDLIKNAGYNLNLVVRKGQYSVIKATRPAVKYTISGTSTTVPVQNAYRRF